MRIRDELKPVNPNTIKAGVYLFLPLALVTLLASSWLGITGLGLVLAAALTMLFAMAVEHQHRSRTALDRLYNQQEAAACLFSLFPFRHPLPPMRNWAVCPDAERVLCDLMLDHQPHLVVDIGSGVSTIVAGYCLERIGKGRVVALDDHPHYAARTTRQLRLHCLADQASVIHAPLREYHLEGETWLWYDLDRMPARPDEPIDLLFVDGPGGHLRPYSRYPALPLLFDRMADQAWIVMDDAGRPDEQKVIVRWTKAYPIAEVIQLPTEKGTCLLRLDKSKSGAV